MVGISAQFNFALLGKTGAGKSAAGNTILGREAFKSKKSFKSATKDVAVASETICGQQVTVFDTPGFFDTDLPEDEIRLKCQEVLQKCEVGPCAYLLVIKADRFTREERETVEKIEELLGQNRLDKTCILFTRGDELEKENMTIKEFLDETEPLKKLVQKYDQRYCVFDNKKKGHFGQKQVKRLLNVINSRFNTGFNTQKRKISKNVEPDTPAARRIVLLGKTGVGKSAAGNTILGQKVFRSVMSSVTRESSEAHATVSGRSVSVVDTPGFFHTQMRHEELVTEIARSVYLSSPGPHAFLIVFPVNNRFTDQELQVAQIIEMMFGEEVLKYSIILFTHGDLIDGECVEEVIEENSRLRDVVIQCGGRFHVFNNRYVNNRDQVNGLLQKIDTMIEENGGGHYSHQMYEDAQRLRQEEEERRQRYEEELTQREEKQRREEIERVRKETEEQIRAEFEGPPRFLQERLKAMKLRVEEEKRQEEERREELAREWRQNRGLLGVFNNLQLSFRWHGEVLRNIQEEKRRQQEIESVIKEMGEKIRAEFEGP